KLAPVAAVETPQALMKRLRSRQLGRFRSQKPQFRLQICQNRLSNWLMDQVLQLIRIVSQVVKLVRVRQFLVMDVLMSLGAHRLVAEVLNAREDVVGEVFDQKAGPQLVGLTA